MDVAGVNGAGERLRKRGWGLGVEGTGAEQVEARGV